MADMSGLRELRSVRYFADWDEFVDAERVASSEASIRRMIDDLIALGAALSEKEARKAVNACVLRFNKLDDGWINTIEAESIFEQIEHVVELCGFECDEDWIENREW